MPASYSLQELTQHIGGELQGEPNAIITSMGTLEGAKKGQLSFLTNSKYKNAMNNVGACPCPFKSFNPAISFPFIT